MNKIMVAADEIDEIVKKLAAKISKDYAGKTVVFVGILKGVFRFYSDLVKYISDDVKILVNFISASSYRDKIESSGEVKVIQIEPISVEGKDVLLVDDILDTGFTLKRLKDLYAAYGANSVKVCVLLDKPSRRVEDIKANYVGKAIENKFVFGYGLDVDEEFRQYNDILYRE